MFSLTQNWEHLKMDILQKLNSMKKKTDEAKQKKARKEGQYEELLKTLKSYNCNTIEEAEKVIRETMKDKEVKEKQLLQGIKELEENYDWNF